MKKLIFPEDVSIESRADVDSVEYQLKIGDEEYVLENYDKALEAYNKVITFGGVYPDVYNKIGIILNFLGKKHEAVDSFKNALKANPNYLDAIVNLGSLFSEIGDEDNAIKQFKKALALDPNNSEALFNLRLAASKESQGRGFDQVEFMIDIGKSYYEENMYRQAIEKFKEVVRIKPNYHDVALLLANAYLQAGFYQNAENVYLSILSKKPDWDVIYVNLGTLHYNLRDYDKSIKYWEKAIDYGADPDKVKLCIQEAATRRENG